MSRIRRFFHADILINIGLIILSCFVYTLAQSVDSAAGHGLGNQFVPKMLSVLLAIASLAIIFLPSFRQQNADAETTQNILYPMALVTGYVLLLSVLTGRFTGTRFPVAFVLSTLLFLGLFVHYLGVRKVRVLLLFPVAVCVVIYLVFQSFLNVSLP